MTYIKIGESLYPVIDEVFGTKADTKWDGREVQTINLEMDHHTANALFVDGIRWAIVRRNAVPVFNEAGEQTGVEMKEEVFDNSEYDVAGSITDHRNGTITVKMGKMTALEESYEMLLGGM